MNSGSRKSQQALRGVDGLAASAAKNFDDARQRASEEVRNLIADVEDLVSKVAHVNDADVARVRAKVEDTLATTKESLEESASSIRARSRRVANVTDGYVRERPWTALGIVAAVGVLVGVAGALSARR